MLDILKTGFVHDFDQVYLPIALHMFEARREELLDPQQVVLVLLERNTQA